MIGKAINLFVILAVLGSQTARAAPIDRHVDQLSQSFRSSVAQAIRENVVRQQLATPQLPASPTVTTIVPAIRAPVEAVAVLEPATTQLSNEIINANISVDVVAAAAEQSAIEAEQAKNAHYSFDTSVTDTINDHSQTRQETRDGVSVRGSYSYSDGFFQRTVHYTADEGGYRVTKEEITPIGDGPRYNPQGTADVRSSLTGNYLITADDFKTSTTTERRWR